MSGSSDALEFLKKKQMSQKIMYSAIFSRSSYCKKLSWQLKKNRWCPWTFKCTQIFFCFLTSSIFSLLISSPFLFLTARTSRFICVLVAILGNYAMTSNCVFFVAEPWPRQSWRWEQCQHRYRRIGVLRMPKFHHQPRFRPSFKFKFEFRFQSPACLRDHLSYHTWASADDNRASSATSTVQFRLFIPPKLPFLDLQFGVNG